VDQLEIDHDNLRAALGTLRDNPGEDAGMRLVASLWRFWLARGHVTEGREHVEQSLLANTTASPALRARALNAAGVLAWEQGDYAPARAHFEASLSVSHEMGDLRGQSFALNSLGNVAWALGDYGTARSRYEASLALRRQLGDGVNIAISLNNLGTVASDRGDYDEARLRHEESLSLRRELQDVRGVAQSLQNLGEVALRRGDAHQAGALYRQSLIQFRELGERVSQYAIRNIEALARVAEASGSPTRAARLFGAAEHFRQTIRAPLQLTDRAAYERCVSVLRAKLGQEHFARAWAEGTVLSIDATLDEALAE
jgi:tetratricopeptide (TPR) repeat protein